jgi:hypothetical protein
MKSNDVCNIYRLDMRNLKPPNTPLPMCTHYTLKKFHFRWYHLAIDPTSRLITKIVLITRDEKHEVPITESICDSLAILVYRGRTTSSTNRQTYAKVIVARAYLGLYKATDFA